MSRHLPSMWGLTLRLSSRRSGTSFSLRRTKRQLAQAQRRTILLGRSLDSSLLLEKQLEERQYQLLHRLQEMRESQQYRETPPSLPQLEQPLLPEHLPPEPLSPLWFQTSQPE